MKFSTLQHVAVQCSTLLAVFCIKPFMGSVPKYNIGRSNPNLSVIKNPNVKLRVDQNSEVWIYGRGNGLLVWTTTRDFDVFDGLVL